MISVIIPVYNNELYLNNLFNDIKNQTHKDFEVIFINDGSTDNSQTLLEEFCANNSFASVFYKQNGGVSSARNLGISKAKGEYIVFWDADDLIHKDFLKVLFDNLQENSLTVCGFSFIDELNNKVDRVYSTNDCDYLHKNHVYLMQQHWLYNALWNKIFYKNIIIENNILFNQDYAVGEDTLFISQYIKYINSYKIVNQLLYTYVRRDKSAMTKYHSNIYTSHKVFYETIISSLDNKNENYKSCLKEIMLAYGTNCVANIWHLVAHLPVSKQQLKFALADYNKNKNIIKPKVNFLLKILLKIKNKFLLKLYYKKFLSRS